MLYPQNGDRIVTIDSVTSLQSMCIRISRSVNRHDNKQHFGLNIKSNGSHFKNSEYAKSTMPTWRPSAIGLYRSLLFRPTGLSAPFIGAIIPTVSYSRRQADELISYTGDIRKMAVGFAICIPHLAILCTADNTSLVIAGDLLRCDWFGKLGYNN